VVDGFLEFIGLEKQTTQAMDQHISRFDIRSLGKLIEYLKHRQVNDYRRTAFFSNLHSKFGRSSCGIFPRYFGFHDQL
jgi:hypothetical protein